jgi:hypothetical protein
MKKEVHISTVALICYWALLPWCLSAQSHDPYTGIWEGNFMEQFKTLVLLDQDPDRGYIGKILMYSGESRIQDDELTRISINNSSITFFIAAKETSFQGEFDETKSAFSGDFIFPDNSRHALMVVKYEKDSLAVKTEPPSLKEKIRQSFPKEELKSDFRELIKKLKEHHPRLNAYCSEASFEQEAEEILESLNADLGLEQYYCRVAPLVASVKCSHTGIRLPPGHQQNIFEAGLFFPLKLFFRDRKAYFLSASASPQVGLKAGFEIAAINNRPIDSIIEEILMLVPSEGNNMTRKYQELNRDFHKYFHMLDPSGKFTIEFVSSDSKGTVELDAFPYSEVHRVTEPEYSERHYSVQLFSNPDRAILKVPSFGIRNMETYFTFLDSTFLELKDKKVQDLTLDLRDNQGGHPIFAAQLLSYLSDREFTYFKRNHDVPDFEPLYQPMQPNPQHYEGRLYVLVNGNCLSTTGHLITLLKYHTEAIFIGEEPGSTFLCNDFSMQTSLSSTGIEVNIPRTTFVTAVSGFKEGEAFPIDYEVQNTVLDILAGRDTYASFVDDLIHVNGKNKLVRF